MDAVGQMLHLRSSVYEVTRNNGERAYLLPLIERVGELSYESRVDALFVGAEALAWVDANRPALRAGASLRNLALHCIRAIQARDGAMQLQALVFAPPELAPPRHASSPSPATHPQQHAAQPRSACA